MLYYPIMIGPGIPPPGVDDVANPEVYTECQAILLSNAKGAGAYVQTSKNDQCGQVVKLR